MEIEIRQIKYEDVKPLEGVAKKEHLSMSPKPNDVWVGAYDGDKLIGFTSLNWNNKTKAARYKSTWVDPEYRRMGIYKKLVMRIYYIGLRLGVKVGTAFVVPELVNFWTRELKFTVGNVNSITKAIYIRRDFTI